MSAACRVLGLLSLFGLVALGGVSAAAADTPTDAPEPGSHQFFNAMGLSINMCESLARERALEIGFQPGRAPANAPKEASYFVDPEVRRAGISFKPKENEGDLELADLHMFVTNTLSREEVMGDIDRIEALYGPGACRESSVNVTCQGTRHVGPYEISLTARYDAQWIKYTFRNRFQPNRLFWRENAPVCINSTATASASPDASAQPESQSSPRSETESGDSQPTTRPPGLPSEPASGESQAAMNPASPPPDSPPSNGQPEQKLLESAQALEEQADTQGSPEPLGGASAAAAPPTDAPEPGSHQFFNAMGLSINMCESLARERALEIGFQPGRAPANAPKEASYFVDPEVRRAGISFKPKENEGDLELADLHMFVTNTLSREEVMGDVDRIEALYGPGACRESSVNVTCQGTRHVGPYEISLRARYDAQWIKYTFRNRFQMNRFFERSPVCINSTATASASPDAAAQPESQSSPRSETEAGDSQPTTSPPGMPSEPASSESQAAMNTASPPPDSPPSSGKPGQKLFESAQALEEQAYDQGSPELHARAAELYEQAAALGHPQAMFNLSRKYARGEGVEQSPETELDLLERAAQTGLPHAQYNLALKYASGSGVAESQERATELLQAAAETGGAEAQLAMAKRKLSGSGTAQSDQEAIDLLEEAAAGGSAEAQYLLGRILEEGILATLDAQRAEQYFCMAAATGYEPAIDKCRRSFLAPNDTAKLGSQVRY